MELASLTYHPPPPPLSRHRHHHHRTVVTSIAFPKPAISLSSSIRASFRNPNYQNPKHHDHITKLAVTGATVAACFLSRFKVKPATAAPPPPPSTAETLPESEDEKIIIIKKDELHRLKELEKQIAERLELYRRRRFDHRNDLKLMLAHIRIIQGDYKDALKMYQDLSTQHPRDFKPHLTRAIIYTLLGKNHDAEISLKMADKVRIGMFLLISDYVRIVPGLAILILLFILAPRGKKNSRRK